VAQTQLAKVVRHLYRLAGAPDIKNKTDGQLLRDFHSRGHEGAFTALVERHGAMVWQVCTRVLGHEQDAEDAFQATFLVLARKAKALVAYEALGGWLHGVAYRVALRARRSNGRRRAYESRGRGADSANPSTLAAWAEVQAILSEEIARLPVKYRTPFVHCIVEGQSRADAAAQLGIKEGTVWSRLCEARRRLQKRLSRRGIELGAVLAAASVAQGGPPLPPMLVATSVRLAASGAAEVAGTAPAAVGLAQGVLQSMAAAKLKLAAGVLFLTTIFGTALGSALLQAPDKKLEGSPHHALRARSNEPDPQPAARVDGHGDALPEQAIARLGTVRFNHGAGLGQLLFSPDAKTIVSAGYQLVRVWDAATGAEKGRFTLAPQFTQGTVFALPDNSTLVSLSEESGGDVVRWSDLSKLKPVRSLSLPIRRRVNSSYHNNALSPDGTLAAVHIHTPAELRVYDLSSGRELHQFPDGGKEVRTVVFAGNDHLITADKKRVIAVWEARTGKLIRSFDHGTRVDSPAVSVDGRPLASFELVDQEEQGRKPERQTVHLWDLETGQRKHSLRLTPKDHFNGVLFAPDGKVLATSSFDENYRYQIVLWDTATGHKIRALDGTGMRLAFSPDGKRLAEGEGSGGNHGKFDVWDIETGRRFSSDASRQAAANAASLSWDGGSVVTFASSSCNSWDIATGRRLSSFALPNMPYSDRSGPTPHGRHVLTFVKSGEEYQPVLWDVASQRKVFTVPSAGQRGPGPTALSSDGSLLAITHVGKENVIHIWDVRAEKEIRSLKGPASWSRLFFSGDNKTLIVAGPKITGVDIASGKELFSWRMEPLGSARQVTTMVVGGPPFDENGRIAWRALAVTPDATRIAAIHDTWWPSFAPKPDENRIAIYDLATGKILRQWNDNGQRTNLWEALAFSDDGRLLASSEGHAMNASEGHYIYLWEAATGAKLRTFSGHRGEIASLGFDGDGRRLVSASLDSTVLVWDLTGRLRDGKLPTLKLSAPEVEARWRALADRDAVSAYQAVWELTAAGQEAVAFLKERLHPVPRPDPKRVDRLVLDLASDEFATRQAAALELKKLDVLAEEALSKVLKTNPPLELRRRAESLLQTSQGPMPASEVLQAMRAVAVLEHIASQKSRQLLEVLAGGAPAAHLTREAKAAAERLRGGVNAN
jgi:RNA polymerase sigma factor (sigma-70 family)